MAPPAASMLTRADRPTVVLGAMSSVSRALKSNGSMPPITNQRQSERGDCRR